MISDAAGVLQAEGALFAVNGRLVRKRLESRTGLEPGVYYLVEDDDTQPRKLVICR